LLTEAGALAVTAQKSRRATERIREVGILS